MTIGNKPIGSGLIAGGSKPQTETIGSGVISDGVIAGQQFDGGFEPVIAGGVAIEFAQSVVTQAGGVAVEFEQSVSAIASGVAIQFEQLIGKIGGGVAIEFAQSVVFGASAGGIAIEFQQTVISTAGGVAVEFEQRVRNAFEQATHLERFGWDARVTINGVLVPLCEIVGDIIVTRNENNAALASVVLGNRNGAQDFSIYHGKTIRIDVDTDAGTRRIFTGTVDFPNVDLVNKTITLECTDRREERINAQLASQVKFIGYTSPYIFDTPDDTVEELRQRLETTPKAVDFDSYGNYRVSDILAKPVPDFMLERCDIAIDPPRLTLATRARLVNQIRLEFEARWTRLRHREKSFSINTPSFCDYMTVIGLDYLRVDSVLATLQSFPWVVKPGSVEFEYLPEAGIYNCGNGKFIWSPIQFNGTVGTLKDDEGNTITDSDGNPKTGVIESNFTNYQQTFAMGSPAASWVAAKRWVQDISENIIITLSAPQSINQYGAISQTQRYGYQVEYDARDFESEEAYLEPGGFVGTSGDFYQDKNGTPADYRQALQTAFSICETAIIRSHRDNTVAFRARRFWPAVELHHTVQIDTNTISCRGKVTQISHRLSPQSKRATTNVVLSLSRAQGSQAPQSLSFPILDAPLVGNAGGDVVYTLYAKRGGSYPTPPVKNDALTAPDIDNMSRQQQKTTDSYGYALPLQNDPLIVNF